jgi:hypothetical protein
MIPDDCETTHSQLPDPVGPTRAQLTSVSSVYCYALALSAQHDGDMQRASTEFSLAVKAWAHADPNLSELRDLGQAKVSNELRKPT